MFGEIDGDFRSFRAIVSGGEMAASNALYIIRRRIVDSLHRRSSCSNDPAYLSSSQCSQN